MNPGTDEIAGERVESPASPGGETTLSLRVGMGANAMESPESGRAGTVSVIVSGANGGADWNDLLRRTEPAATVAGSVFGLPEAVIFRSPFFLSVSKASWSSKAMGSTVPEMAGGSFGISTGRLVSASGDRLWEVEASVIVEGKSSKDAKGTESGRNSCCFASFAVCRLL